LYNEIMYDTLARKISSFEIFDAHGHYGSDNRVHIPYYSAEDMIQTMNLAGVKKLFISSLIGISNNAYLGNTMVGDAIAKYPDRLIGMASIDPHKPSQIEKELKRCFGVLGMKMIKLHPSFSECPMVSRGYQSVYEFANERGIPILNHSWEDIHIVERILNKYPNVVLIQAHSGGSWNGRSKNDFIDAAKEYPNFFVDTSYTIAYFGAFEKLVDYIGADKIIFGSDCPYMDLTYQLGKILFADISIKDKTKILSGNIRKIIEENSPI